MMTTNFGNYHIIFIFSRNVLQILHKTGRYKKNEQATIKAFFLPFSDAFKYAAKVIPIDDLGKMLMELFP